MKFHWSKPLERYVQDIFVSQESGCVFPKEEVFLDAQTGIDALRNFELFYYDGYQYHLTPEADNIRRSWLRSWKLGLFSY